MRALLVSHSDGGGGAGRAAYRLLQSLPEANIAATMAVDTKVTGDRSVVPLTGEFSRRIRLTAEQFADKVVRPAEPANYSAAVSGALTTGLSRRTRPDVINLHWTGFGAASIAQMGRMNVPSVWTLHDMWVYGGGSHYFDPPDAGLTSWVARRKAKHWRSPRILVTPSRWLRDEASRSPFVREWPVRVIPNPIDLAVYRPQDSVQARRTLNLDPDRPAILFALTNDLRDRRKGADVLWQALQHLASTTAGEAANFQIAVLGHAQEPQDWPHLPMPTHWLGRTFDDDLVARAYAASDVVVIPSRMDNLPQVGTEAAACGRPVVAFDIGGLPDIVEHRKSGYLARPHDAQDLAHGLAWVLGDSQIRQQLGTEARRRAESEWNPKRVAKLYRETFEEAIALHRHTWAR